MNQRQTGKATSAEPLRIGGYIRVSEVEQRDKGKSLATQRTRIEAAAAQIGGQIVDWYGGQEHATPGHERDEFERMLRDIAGGRINAACAADPTRWSRDTVVHEQAMRILKRHHSRLFFGPVEQDLRSAAVQIGLTLNTKASETETGSRLDASVFGRIEQAALGFVTSGHAPYGRRVPAVLVGTRRVWESNADETAKWQVIPDAKEYVEKCANEYLAGRTWGEVAAIVGDDENTVRRRVLASGGTWRQTFRLRDGQRPEEFAAIAFLDRLSFTDNEVTVTIPVPALLDEVTLRRVKAKSIAQYANYKARNKQPLGGYMHCENCLGSIGTHYHAKSGAVYLQHNGHRLPGCPANFGRYEPIQRSFLRRSVEIFANPEEMEAAVTDAALAETRRHPELEAQLRDKRGEQAALKKEHASHYEKIKALDLAGSSTMLARLVADAKVIEAQLAANKANIERLEAELKVTRLPPDLADRIEFVLFCLRGFGVNSLWFLTWPKTQQRVLCTFLFGQPGRKAADGTSRREERAPGLYLRRATDAESGKTVIIWTAHGWFPQVSDIVWLDAKVAAYFRPGSTKSGLDRKRLLKLIPRLDLSEFGFARAVFNARKPAGTRARSSRRRCASMPRQSSLPTTIRPAWRSPARPTSSSRAT